MSCPLDKHELYRLLEPYAKYGDDDGFYVRSKGVTALSEFLGIPFKDAMIILLEQDIWPERFCRNRGVFTSRQMARLLSLRVFIAGCGGLGGHVASLLARMGAGGFRLCDPDIFEESNLNRQYFCTEKTLGRSKALVCREGLLDIASYLEIDARVLAVAPDNLSSLLEGMDAVIDCLDSIPRKCSPRGRSPLSAWFRVARRRIRLSGRPRFKPSCRHVSRHPRRHRRTGRNQHRSHSRCRCGLPYGRAADKAFCHGNSREFSALSSRLFSAGTGKIFPAWNLLRLKLSACQPPQSSARLLHARNRSLTPQMSCVCLLRFR